MSKYFSHPELYAIKDQDGNLMFTNLAPRGLCEAQLKEKFPNKDQAGIDKLVEKQSNVLEKETPAVFSWQDFTWPVDEGDYCQFVLAAGQQDLNELAEGGDGKAFFAANLNDNSLDSGVVDNLWQSLKPGKMVESGAIDENWPAMVLVFKSVNRNKYFLIFDAA